MSHFKETDLGAFWGPGGPKLIFEGHVNGDTAFSGQSLKRFNAAARIQDQQVFSYFVDIVCHVP